MLIEEIHPLCLERETYTDFFISDINKTKHPSKPSHTAWRQEQTRYDQSPRIESESLATVWDGVAKGSREDIPEGAPRPAHTSSLIFSSSGAAAGAGRQERTDVVWGGGRGPRSGQRFVWRGRNQKHLEGEKLRTQVPSPPLKKRCLGPAGATARPGRALGRPDPLRIPLSTLGWGAGGPGLCRGVIGFDCADTKRRLVLNSAARRAPARATPCKVLAREIH